MIVQTVNRMARGMDYPSLVGPDGLTTLVTDVATPGTAFQNASYGMSGLGDFSSISDYFTSTNYYLGYFGLAAAAYLLLSGSSKSKRRAITRKANLKGSIAREQELLKAS